MNEEKNYHLIDDALCNLDDSIMACENCRECEYFYECMEEEEEE